MSRDYILKQPDDFPPGYIVLDRNYTSLFVVIIFMLIWKILHCDLPNCKKVNKSMSAEAKV